MTSGDGIRVLVLARTKVVPQILSLKKMPSLSSHVALPSEQVPWFSIFLICVTGLLSDFPIDVRTN